MSEKFVLVRGKKNSWYLRGDVEQGAGDGGGGGVDGCGLRGFYLFLVLINKSVYALFIALIHVYLRGRLTFHF